MARTRWPPDWEPWPLAQARQNRNGTPVGATKNLGPADRSNRKTTSGVSRIEGQAGTQATDPTPRTGQTLEGRAGALFPILPAEYLFVAAARIVRLPARRSSSYGVPRSA